MGVISRCAAFSHCEQNIGSQKMKTVFTILLLLVVHSLAQDTHFCPDGWDLHHPEGRDECKCFLFAHKYEDVTHGDATTLCESHGAYLAELVDGPGDNYWVVGKLLDIYNTKKQAGAAVNDLSGPHFEDQWWIGAKSYTKHNEHVPGEWIWEHANTTVQWFDWAPDEPNDYHRQQCLAYIRYMYPTVIGWEPFYNWNDWDCNALADYICEKPCDMY